MRAIPTLVCVLPLIVLSASTNAAAPVQDAVEQGPYRVGFSCESRTDHSRSFTNHNNESTSRPVQLWVWYPAINADSNPDKQMSIARYLEFAVYKADPERTIPDAFEKKVDHFERVLRRITTPEKINGHLHRPTRAHHDAPPAQGRFPLVVYACGAPGGPYDNIPLIECLASHGFVVASVPYLGLHPHDQTEDLPLLEATVADMGFALGAALQKPFTDRNSIAAAGFSWGGWAATVLATRDQRIDALVLLDPYPGMAHDWASAPIQAAAPRQSLALLDTPILEFAHARKALSSPLIPLDERVEHTVFAHAPYASCSLIQLLDMDHFGFSAFNLDLQESSASEVAARHDAHALLVPIALEFLKAQFAKQADQLPNAIDNRITERSMSERTAFRHRPATPLPPTGEAFAQFVRDEGPDAAREVFREARRINPDIVLFGNREVAMVGIEYHGQGDLDNAIKCLELQIEANPKFVRNYIDLGFVYEQSGHSQKMLDVCQQIVQIEPGNHWAKRRLDER